MFPASTPRANEQPPHTWISSPSSHCLDCQYSRSCFCPFRLSPSSRCPGISGMTFNPKTVVWQYDKYLYPLGCLAKTSWSSLGTLDGSHGISLSFSYQCLTKRARHSPSGIPWIPGAPFSKKKQNRQSASASTSHPSSVKRWVIVAFSFVTARVAEVLMSVLQPRQRCMMNAPLSIPFCEVDMKSYTTILHQEGGGGDGGLGQTDIFYITHTCNRE